MHSIERDIVYGHSHNEELTADVYCPQFGENHPIILFIHGGGWKAGSKEMFQEYGPYLANKGFFAVSIDYHLSTPEQPTWPLVMDDVNQALSWLVEEAPMKWNINADKISVIGESCGAQLALLLALEHQARDKIQAIVGVYGVYDVKDWWHHTQETREDNPVGDFIGGSPKDFPNEYMKASPIDRLHGSLPDGFTDIPFFLLWGDSDDIVPPKQSEDFTKQLQLLGNEVETLVAADAGHYWFSILPWIEGGRLIDYPNDIAAPELVSYLSEKLVK